MSGKHTRGLLSHQDKRPQCGGFSLFAGDQFIGFVSDSDECTDWQANAERLVACWNACDGIDTADLNAGSTESKVNTTTATPTPEALAIAVIFKDFAIDHTPDGWPAVKQMHLNAAAAELERQHAENQSLTTENKRLREAILRLRHWSMAGELPEYPAHLPPSQQQKTALKPVSKPLCRDCADFGPICPTTGLPCDGSGEKP